jgi:DNA polymerase-1
MFIGEAPGAEEDAQGKPFVGPAGQVLTKCLIEAGFDREQVYITNVYHVRPPENRVPTMSEIVGDASYLIREIREVQPKIIVLLGATALKVFLDKAGITRLRGSIFSSEDFNCKLVPTYHPSYILRNPGDTRLKDQFVKDLRMIKLMLEGKSLETKRLPTDYQLVKTLEDLDAALAELRAAETVDFDLETTGLDVDKHRIISIGFSPAERVAYVVPIFVDGKEWWSERQADVMQEIKTFFESDVSKSAHLGAFDIPFLRAIGIQVKNFAYDTIIMHHLLNENARSHGLKELALEFTDLGMYNAEIEEWKTKLVIEGDKTYAKKTVDFAKIPFDVLWPYAAADVDATGRLRRLFLKELDTQNLMPVFRRIMMPVQNTLIDVEWAGVKIDIERLHATRQEYQSYAEDIDKQLQAHPVTAQAKVMLELDEINYSSPVQLRKILFNILKLRPVKKTKTGNASTDEITLKELAGVHEIPRMITEKRSYEHLVSAYGENFEAFIRKDGRIHSKFLLYGTEIHRLASRNPNLQNIARDEKDESGKATIASRARDIFVADEGCVLVAADYAQIQFRIWVNYMNDQKMIEDLRQKRDVHKVIASMIFNKPEDQITKEERQNAKAFTYATIMGASAWKIASHFKISEEKAQVYITRFFANCPKARQYAQGKIQEARQRGFVISLFGARRRLPEITSPDQKMRGHAERSAVNFPIQNLEAHILYAAMNRIAMAFKAECPTARLVLPVHDSLVTEVRESDWKKAAEIMEREMTRAMPGIIVPLAVEVKYGKSLGNLKYAKENN